MGLVIVGADEGAAKIQGGRHHAAAALKHGGAHHMAMGGEALHEERQPVLDPRMTGSVVSTGIRDLEPVLELTASFTSACSDAQASGQTPRTGHHTITSPAPGRR